MRIISRRRKYKTVKRTQLREGYQSLRTLTPQELEAWYCAVEQACRKKS